MSDDKHGYEMEYSDQSFWDKTLTYAIADPAPIPAVGYADDLAVLVATVATIVMYINDEVKEKAEQKLTDWFGE